MRWLTPLLVALIALLPSMAAADDSVSQPPARVLIGQQFTLTIVIETPSDAEVELDTRADGWAGVEVVQIDGVEQEEIGSGESRYTFTVTAAAFEPGDYEFTPAAFVTREGISEPRALPSSAISVATTLGPNAPLELSPLDPPESVSGAQSPFLVPAIVGGAGLGLLGFLALTAVVVQRIATRPRRTLEPEPVADGRPSLEGIEEQLASDPVAAYRTMAISVRSALAEQYGFPARSLTTRELQRRMEAEGVDRWQSRLVRGLLDECDQVVYAGYRPAMERRTADLGMARELLEDPA